MSDEIRAKFANDLAVVQWRDVRTHVERDSVILVDPKLDLVDVAVAVAADATDRVGPWIGEGRLAKPGPVQLQTWEGQLDKPFRLLIVRPYLLVQEAGEGGWGSDCPGVERTKQ